jgi:excinuclease ABC subunit C
MPDETLKKKVAKLPRAPGVYLMKDAKGVVLYVGKAKSLRNRVGSYFQERPGDARQRLGDLVGRVADVEVVEADSEVDALLMEARLIKDIQPPFNERLRDSKLYPYLEITLGDDFPGVYVTRRRDRAKSRFYGPFTDARGLRGAVQLMQPVFRFRTCTLAISADDPKRRFQRPCLLHFIGRCTAPCADRVARGDYRKQIGLLQRFLSGKRKGVLQSLRRAMRTAADAYDYEGAARLRDQLRALEALGKRGSIDFFPEAVQPPVIDPREGLRRMAELFELPAPPRTIDGIDISHLSGADSVGSVVTFVDGKPFKHGYRRFRIKTIDGIDDFAMMGEVVARRFRRLHREKRPFPDILLLDGGKGQLRAAQEVFDRLGVTPPLAVSLAKREELLYHGRPAREIALKRSDPALRIFQYVRDEANRFAVHYHHILRGKRVTSSKE